MAWNIPRIMWIEWVNFALRRFLHNHGWQYRHRKKPEFWTLPYTYRIQSLSTSRFLYGTHDHRQHCTPQTFEQFGALYMHNPPPPADKHPTWPGFEPSTSEFLATCGSNEPSGTAEAYIYIYIYGRFPRKWCIWNLFWICSFSQYSK